MRRYRTTCAVMTPWGEPIPAGTIVRSVFFRGGADVIAYFYDYDIELELPRASLIEERAEIWAK